MRVGVTLDILYKKALGKGIIWRETELSEEVNHETIWEYCWPKEPQVPRLRSGRMGCVWCCYTFILILVMGDKTAFCQNMSLKGN